MAEVMSWENVVSAYYPGPTKGWGTAKFASPKARTDFLERKQYAPLMLLTYFITFLYVQC